jgi:hypothetical protein
MREIYPRDPEDRYYDPSQIEVSDPIEVCLGQLKMMILTDKTSVLGDPRFGLSLESLVYELNLSEYSLRKEIDLHITNYCRLFKEMGGSYTIKFFLGANRDIALIDFSIPFNGNESPIVSLKLS